MNKKAFTLVELLGVVVVIALIGIIVITPLTANLRNSSGKLDETALKVLFASIDEYMMEESVNYPKSNGLIYYISLSQLIDAKVLDKNFLSTYSEEVLSPSSIIKVTAESGKYRYELLKDSVTFSKLLKNKFTMPSNIYTYMNGKYIKGNVTNNYVWYSGFLWRILGINEDGSIRLIMDQNASSLIYGAATTSTYNSSNSYIKNWLNNYFYPKIRYNDLIVDGLWCSDITTSVNDAKTNCSVTFLDKVGLLSLFEYNLHGTGANGFLTGTNKADYFTLTQYSNSSVYKVSSGSATTVNTSSLNFVKPVINVRADSYVSSGLGTSINPFVIGKPIEELSSANKIVKRVNPTAGEYIQFFGNTSNTFRIVEVSADDIKIVLNDVLIVSGGNYYYQGAISSSSSSKYSFTNDIGNFMNASTSGVVDRTTTSSTNVKANILSKPVHLGDSYSAGLDYRTTAHKKSNTIFDGKISLIKIGELHATQVASSNPYWTMTPASSTAVYSITSTGVQSTTATNTSPYGRPVLYINNQLIISGGNGTVSSPYIVK